jgi:hypothetical protein
LLDDTINFQHDPLASAIALGWKEGVEIREIPLRSEIQEGRLCQRIGKSGQPAGIVTRVAGDRFNEFWLDTVVST